MNRRIFKSRRSRSILMFLGGLVLLFLFQNLALGAFKAIQRPFVSAGTWVTDQMGITHSQARFNRTETKSIEEYQRALNASRAALDALETENERLTNALNFSDRRRLHPLGANIISRNASNDSAQVVIDRGAADGVFVGAPVIVEEGIFVGKVISVTKHTSIISTITDKESATAVSLLNESRTIGIAEGLNGNLSILRFIPIDEVIEVDDLTVTSGLEEFIPSGLLMGLVNTVRPDPNAPFQEAIIEPVADIRRYTKLVVLLPLEL